MNQLQRLLRAVDGFQQRHAWTAFPLAVVKKYGDDQVGNHAALLAYYGFFSLFPLLLVLVTVRSFVLEDLAKQEERRPEQTVEVSFTEDADHRDPG